MMCVTSTSEMLFPDSMFRWEVVAVKDTAKRFVYRLGVRKQLVQIGSDQHHVGSFPVVRNMLPANTSTASGNATRCFFQLSSPE